MKLAIVGSHPGTRSDAPWHDEEYQIWVFNEAANQDWVKRCDAVFQMHKPEVYRAPGNRSDPQHWEWLQKDHDFVIWMQEKDDEVPASRRYPREKITAELLGGNDFFLSSIDYGLAFALYLDYDQIDLYGVEMASNTEYHYQREGLRVWLSVAHALGVEVNINGELALYNVPVYGYDGKISHPVARYDESIAESRKKYDLLGLERSKRNQALSNKRIDKLLVAVGRLIDYKIDIGYQLGLITEHARYKDKLLDKLNANCAAFIDRQEYEGAAGAIKDSIPQHQEMLFRKLGVIDYMAKVYADTNDPSALDNIRALARNAAETAEMLGNARGIYDTNHILASELDLAIRAAGGDKAVQAVTESNTWPEQ